MRTLRVVSGPAAGESAEVEGDVVIGREGADLTIPDPQISRRHAVVRAVDGGVEVEDLGSLNGTFLDGERLGAPVTLTAPGRIRVGDSEIDVELVLEPAGAGAGATQLAAPPPGVAQARGSVRRVEPETPAGRGDGQAGEAAAPPPAAAPARPTPPPQPPPAAREAPTAGPRRGRALATLAVLLLALAGAAVAAFFLTRGDDEEAATSRPLVASVSTAVLEQTATKITLGGTVNQSSPGGIGAVITRLTLKGDLSKGKPINVNGAMVFRFDGGRIDATVKGTATQRKDETTILTLTGTVKSGTRDFEGAKGSFKVRSSQDPANPTVGHSNLDGTITY